VFDGPPCAKKNKFRENGGRKKKFFAIGQNKRNNLGAPRCFFFFSCYSLLPLAGGAAPGPGPPLENKPFFFQATGCGHNKKRKNLVPAEKGFFLGCAPAVLGPFLFPDFFFLKILGGRDNAPGSPPFGPPFCVFLF